MTQNEKILAYIKNHIYITQREAFGLGVYRLAARISDLRQQGHDIRKNTIRVRNADGSKSSVAAYFMVPDYEPYEEGGEDGRE